MYFDRSPLYSQRIITYKNEVHYVNLSFISLFEICYLYYKITLSKLYNFFMGADFSNLFWFGKKMNENSQTKRKKNMCDIYVTEFFTSKNIVNQL